MQPFPHPSDATQNLIKIGQLASEIFKFEIVDDDGQVSSKPFYMLFEKQMHKMCIKTFTISLRRQRQRLYAPDVNGIKYFYLWSSNLSLIQL